MFSENRYSFSTTKKMLWSIVTRTLSIWILTGMIWYIVLLSHSYPENPFYFSVGNSKLGHGSKSTDWATLYIIGEKMRDNVHYLTPHVYFNGSVLQMTGQDAARVAFLWRLGDHSEPRSACRVADFVTDNPLALVLFCVPAFCASLWYYIALYLYGAFFGITADSLNTGQVILVLAGSLATLLVS